MVVVIFLPCSLLKIIKELRIIMPEPIYVLVEGSSLNKSVPEIIAKTKLKYLMGVTEETLDLLMDMVNIIFPTDPEIPIKTKKTRSFIVGIIQS